VLVETTRGGVVGRAIVAWLLLEGATVVVVVGRDDDGVVSSPRGGGRGILDHMAGVLGVTVGWAANTTVGDDKGAVETEDGVVVVVAVIVGVVWLGDLRRGGEERGVWRLPRYLANISSALGGYSGGASIATDCTPNRTWLIRNISSADHPRSPLSSKPFNDVGVAAAAVVADDDGEADGDDDGTDKILDSVTPLFLWLDLGGLLFRRFFLIALFLFGGGDGDEDDDEAGEEGGEVVRAAEEEAAEEVGEDRRRGGDETWVVRGGEGVPRFFIHARNRCINGFTIQYVALLLLSPYASPPGRERMGNHWISPISLRVRVLKVVVLGSIPDMI
jgi:hypothetical protein